MFRTPLSNAWRLAAALIVSGVAASVGAFAQNSLPTLTRPQRAALETVVAAVDAATATPPTADVDWQLHLLRASDGSHYVAFTISAPAAQIPQQPAVLYVRLATRQPLAVTAERSAVMEWLKGKRTDPRLVANRRGIAFGEMPVYGAGSAAARGAANTTSDLRLLELERDRAREQKAAQERQRKAALESADARAARDLLPFEDFDLRAETALDGERRIIRRSVTAGPGDYDLFVAWAATSEPKPAAVRVIKRTLSLPTASTTEFALSSVILADDIALREVPYTSDQQAAHPYAIGAMEIAPTRDAIFTNDEQMGVVFQIVNARPTALGKPDVAVAFQLLRNTANGEQHVATLTPQYYTAATMPPTFDIAKGHPIFAAMSVPLATLARGDYRLRIMATDRIAARTTGVEASFNVVATPRTLLTSAPVGTPFRSQTALQAPIVDAVVNRLRPSTASAGLTKALDAARERRFVDLLRDEPVNADEQPARTALRGLGLLALGDARMCVTLITQALQRSVSPSVHVFLGACRALEGNDREALVSWQTAIDRSLDLPLVAPLMIDAYLRQRDLTRAGQLINAAQAAASSDPSLSRAAAALLVAQGQEAEAVTLMEARLSTQPDDVDAQYVLLHALFAGFVHKRGPGSHADGIERFRVLANRYVEAKSPRASLVTEWLEVAPRRDP